MLDEAAIRAMLLEDLIEIGAHTESHAILSLLKTDQKFKQIENSVKRITELSGEQCKHFAYPNDRKQDYDQESMDFLQSLGVDYAVTTIEGMNASTANPLELKRIGIGSDMGLKEFESVLCDSD